MAKPIFASPITKQYKATKGAALSLADQSTLSKVVVRAASGTAARAALAATFGSSRTTDQVLIAATRPDEWMLIGAAKAVDAKVASLPVDGFVSIVDWTHGRGAFRLTGADAASTLEKLSGIDWSDNMTPDGAVLSASVGGATCDIVRNDAGKKPSYLLLCDRSFGQYLFDTIVDAGEEFAISASN